MTIDLAMEKIKPNLNQPRKHFDPEKLQELADSIKQVGILNPILVRPDGDNYEIVHGERRWRACQLAGLATIRAEVEDLTDETAYTVSIVENTQREDLNPIDSARSILRLMQEHELTQAQAAKRISKTRTWVAQKLRLLGLPDETLAAIKEGHLTEGHARQLLKLQSAKMDDHISSIAVRAAKECWSVKRLEAEVNIRLVGGNDSAPRQTSDYDQAAQEYSEDPTLQKAFVAGARWYHETQSRGIQLQQNVFASNVSRDTTSGGSVDG